MIVPLAQRCSVWAELSQLLAVRVLATPGTYPWGW